MLLSLEAQAILSAIVVDMERKVGSTRNDFPFGKAVHDSLKITDEQAKRFLAELREKVLFPIDQ